MIDDREYQAWYPAARCKDCGVVTWEVSLARGHRRPEMLQHTKGCTKPLGKIDLGQRRGKAKL